MVCTQTNRYNTDEDKSKDPDSPAAAGASSSVATTSTMATDGYRNIGIAMRHVSSSGSVDIDIFVDGSLILSGTIGTNLNDPLISRFATRSRSATYSGSEYNGPELLMFG